MEKLQIFLELAVQNSSTIFNDISSHFKAQITQYSLNEIIDAYFQLKKSNNDFDLKQYLLK